MTLWSGRVGGELAREVWEFLRADDAELLPYDLQATLLHAQRLHAAGILDDDELAEVTTKLAAIETIDEADEDVHSSIERQLGEVGRKIHAGRSRNDQVAAAFRLYVGAACADAEAALAGFANAILARAEEEAQTAMPGYTHLQRAQPVTVGHHLLAWVEMLERDRARFAFAAAQAAPSPLGAGALAGSTLDLPAPPDAMRNTIDAVADCDFALDYLYATATLFVHLSRIGEELVLWTTSEFGFARLPENAATGSSIMPQKLNPDVAELARGKAGTAFGRLTGLLATVKSLPLAYDRDLQEDKPPVFAARRDVAGALGALTVLVAGLELDNGRLAAAASDPLLLATDAAEELVSEGVPFRDAHAQCRKRTQEAGQAADGRARLAPRELGRVRVLLLGHDRGAGGGRVGELGEAVLRRRPQHELLGQAGEVHEAERCGEHELGAVVAVGDGVHGVLEGRREPQLGSDRGGVERQARARQRSGAERTHVGRLAGVGDAMQVALERPHVGGQVLSEPHRLGALAVGIAGHEQVALAIGEVEQRQREAAHALDHAVAGVLRPQPHRRLHLVVAAAAGVHPRAKLAQQPLDGGVHVLIARVGLDLDLLQSGADLGRPLGRDQPLAAEHARMRRRRREVERQQPPVDLERRGEGQHGGVEPAGQPPRPQGLAHAGAACCCDPAASVAAAQVFVGSDHTWMKPAAAPCW